MTTDPIRLPVREGYDRWSEVYDTDGNPLILLEEPIVRGWLGDVAGRRVVDVGCGTGQYASCLTAAGANVVALDFSEGMMARAKRRVTEEGKEGTRAFLEKRKPNWAE